MNKMNKAQLVIPEITIGEALRMYRSELGLTQQEMAARIGISRGGYNRLESPRANPRLRTIWFLFAERWLRIEAQTSCLTNPPHFHLCTTRETAMERNGK